MGIITIDLDLSLMDGHANFVVNDLRIVPSGPLTIRISNYRKKVIRTETEVYLLFSFEYFMIGSRVNVELKLINPSLIKRVEEGREIYTDFRLQIISYFRENLYEILKVSR